MTVPRILEAWRGTCQLLRKRRLGLLAILCMALVSVAQAQTPLAREYQLKAIFLVRFAQFVQWPDTRLHADQPLVIGVLGEDPFGTFLDSLIEQNPADARQILIRRFDMSDEIDCHILFVSKSAAAGLPLIAGELQERSVLTVGDSASFSRHSGIIRLATETGKIRLMINLDMARASNLEISSKLLRSASIVGKGQG